MASVLTSSQHAYEIRPRKDHRGVDLASDALPFGRLWYGKPSVYDETGNVDRNARARWRFQRAVAITVCDCQQNKSRHAVKRGGFSTS
jgi:hypothetical protein